jgi:cytoskeleton protein RodZ
MQDSSDFNKTSEVSDAVVVSAGQQLRRAREAAGVSVDEVAYALHLEREVILDVEADDHSALGALVFIRGYLRSYARYLELDEGQVLAGLQLAEPEPEEFRTHSARREVKPGASLVNFLLWVMVGSVVVVGLLYVGIGGEPEPAEEVDKGQFVIPVDEVVAEPEPEERVLSDEIANANQAELSVEPQVAEQPPGYTLSFSFNDECWVEISDVENRLLYGLEKPGDTVDVTGRPPIRIFLGNVSGVSMQIDGRDFVIPSSAQGRSNTARFTVTAADLAGVNE